MLLELLTRIVTESPFYLNEAFNFIDENKHFIQIFFRLRKELKNKTLKEAAKEKKGSPKEQPFHPSYKS